MNDEPLMVETKSGRYFIHDNQQYSVMAISNEGLLKGPSHLAESTCYPGIKSGMIIQESQVMTIVESNKG